MIPKLLVVVFAIHAIIFLFRALRTKRLSDWLLVATFVCLTSAYALVGFNVEVLVPALGFRLRDVLRTGAVLCTTASIFLLVRRRLTR